ncbi:Outer membrane protein OmpA [Thioclava dalianensis]|nr:OmpA family protein [Thioclava dalianensis]SFM82305.1 Outer membrane protein OmpA [Thioclava dalianensis]
MKTLKTTTALVAGLTALMPATIPVASFAQTDATAQTACIAKAIADGKSDADAKKACADDAAKEGDAAQAQPEEAQPAPEADPAPKAEADAAPSQDKTKPAPEADAAPAPEADSSATAEPEATPAPAPKADGSAKAETDAAPKAQAGAQADVKADAETQAQDDTAPTPEAEARTNADTATTDAAPMTQDNADAAAKAAIEGQKPEGTKAGTEAETTTEAPKPENKPAPKAAETEQPKADDTASGDATAKTDAEAQAKPAPTSDGTATTDAQTEATASGDATAEGDQAATDTEAKDAPAAAQVLEKALADNKQAADGAPVENEALSSSADDPGADEVTAREETITKENARSSDEDFATGVSGKSTTETQTAEPAKKKERGLNLLESTAVAGLGALAVGALLNNGSKVAVNSGDRVVVQNQDGSYALVKDDNALLRQPGARIRTQDFADGSSRTIVTKEDGSQIVTVYDGQRRMLKRTLIQPNGERYLLIDDATGTQPVDVSNLPKAAPTVSVSSSDEAALRKALDRQARVDRTFTLAQVRDIRQVRDLAPAVAVDNITFPTGSAAIQPDQARALAALGQTLQARIADNPREIFLIEGHTDAVGSAASNLALSDRRAESVALALSEYFGVPSENLVVQGYGEQDLKVQTDGPSEANRRAAVRRITDLLRVAQN